MENENQLKISEEEEFYLAFNWFYEELNALRHPPIEACELEGNYNVAHEIWHLLPNENLLLNPLSVFTSEQIDLLTELFDEVKSIPVEARGWTTVSSDSVKNMSHNAWSSVRKKAQLVYLALAPIALASKNYFDKND